MDSSAASTAPPQGHGLAGRRVTVMGLGRFGGGVGAVRWLAMHGAHVTLTDIKPRSELRDSLRAIAGLPLAGERFGEHCAADFTSAHLVVASPAVRPDHPCLAAARAADVPITTEVAMFCRACPGRVIGVTGSVGKSTTAAIIQHLLQSAGVHCWLGGNLGGSLLDHLPVMQPGDWVVLELSSFQLQYLDADQWSPEIAVVTSFFPNHLDWHLSLDEYRGAKQTLLRWQRATDRAVLNGDDPEVRQWRTCGLGIVVEASSGRFLIRDTGGASRSTLSIPELPHLPGRHNQRNAALALAAVSASELDIADPIAALSSFRSLPHRLEFLGEVRGRRFYNDSKATTPESAIAALQAFDAPLVLLAGGSDKCVDLSALAEQIARRAKAVALMGATGPVLDRLMASHLSTGQSPLRLAAESFPHAFQWAVEHSDAGDVVLLSPGCASFGWFRDYVDRGDQFRAAVEDLTR